MSFDGWLKGRASCVVNVFLAPFVIVYHAFSIYIFPCVGTILLRIITAVSCFLCNIFCRNLVLFTDSEFKADDSSLGEQWLKDNQGKSPKWVRVEKLAAMKGTKPSLFAGAIEPRDICQGAVGDCWLMSALACMAEFPGCIAKIFETREYSPRGKYTVRLFHAGEGKWHRVTVDDYFPVNSNGEAVFSKPHGPEIWVMVLEKAIAKFVGSYAALDGGNEVWAWATLTGSQVYGFKLTPKGWEKKNYTFMKDDFKKRAVYVDRNKTAEVQNCESFWQTLLLFDFRDAIISASINSSDGEHKRTDGLVEGHAYSLLQVKEVDGFRLIQLRNPWGSFEWNGDWSDTSDKWIRHPNVKNFLNMKGEDDGAFWMSYSDFLETYNSIAVCDRDVSIDDLVLDHREDTGFHGIIGGCLLGFARFWCFCESCRFLYCGHRSTSETPQLGTCCAPWMFVNDPIHKLRSWWHARETLGKSKEGYVPV
eukprot:c9706_g3_i1.p1 GENE.c9706_g3_i1~~c9706_g3_i1.p1  ORF type:complete len:477 (-),score=94.08 c9706_g3_i1:47-1477(-)